MFPCIIPYILLRVIQLVSLRCVVSMFVGSNYLLTNLKVALSQNYGLFGPASSSIEAQLEHFGKLI